MTVDNFDFENISNRGEILTADLYNVRKRRKLS